MAALAAQFLGSIPNDDRSRQTTTLEPNNPTTEPIKGGKLRSTLTAGVGSLCLIYSLTLFFLFGLPELSLFVERKPKLAQFSRIWTKLIGPHLLTLFFALLRFVHLNTALMNTLNRPLPPTERRRTTKTLYTGQEVCSLRFRGRRNYPPVPWWLLSMLFYATEHRNSDFALYYGSIQLVRQYLFPNNERFEIAPTTPTD